MSQKSKRISKRKQQAPKQQQQQQQNQSHLQRLLLVIGIISGPAAMQGKHAAQVCERAGSIFVTFARERSSMSRTEHLIHPEAIMI